MFAAEVLNSAIASYLRTATSHYIPQAGTRKQFENVKVSQL